MPFFDTDAPIAFAHRGLARDGDENSMAAFQRAVDLGVRYLETDTHASADGVALAIHDPTLDRVTDRSGRVDALPYADLAAARIAGREPIPRLDDLLGTWTDVQVNIDVKSDHAVGPVLDAIRRTASAARVCVAAFSDRRVRALRAALGPAVPSALGPREVASVWAATRRGRTPDGGAGRCLQVPRTVRGRPFADARLIEGAHAAGLAVHVWTVNDRERMRVLLDQGVDGIITDRADILREVLIERGQWLTPTAR